jgi:hypothetical protein
VNVCSRRLPSCRGEVHQYRVALRPATEVRNLCDGCVCDLTAAPMRLELIAVTEQQPRGIRRLVTSGGAA